MSGQSRASVPEAQATAWDTPTYPANSASSSLISGPMMYCPWARTASMRRRTSGSMARNWAFKSMKGIPMMMDS